MGCIVTMTLGQILFKQAAINFNEAQTIWALKGLIVLFAAGFLYFLQALMWVWVLRTEDLSQAYPLLALSFITIPVAAFFLYGEQMSLKDLIGALLICCGIVLTTPPNA